MTPEASLGTVLLSLIGIVLLVGVFYALVTGKPPLARRQGVPDERASASDRGRHPSIESHRVVLHNDDDNDMISVVRSLGKSVGLGYKQAYSIMNEAHTKGSATVILCSEESAAMYQKALIDRGLTVTVEPV